MCARAENQLHPCCMIAAYQNRPCKVPADRQHAGRWFCHLHDPKGKHQQKLANKHHQPIRINPLDFPEPVAPLIEDHTLALFESPTPTQTRIIKKRLTAWRRSTYWNAQTAQPDPEAPQTPNPASSAQDARYAQ